MEILKKAYEIINQKQDEIIGTLQQFIAIPSVSVRTPGDKPFGEDVDRAFKFMLEKAENDGFETFNADNYGGHIDFRGCLLYTSDAADE